MLRFNHDADTWEVFTGTPGKTGCSWCPVTPQEARELFDNGCRVAI